MEGATIPASNRVPMSPAGRRLQMQEAAQDIAFPTKTANCPKCLHCPVLFSPFSEGHDSRQKVWTRGL